MEKDYNKDVLERTVASEGNKDTETLYIDGAPVLRAYYEDGRKVKEVQIREDMQ
jgi:hypothetical protein